MYIPYGRNQPERSVGRNSCLQKKRFHQMIHPLIGLFCRHFQKPGPKAAGIRIPLRCNQNRAGRSAPANRRGDPGLVIFGSSHSRLSAIPGMRIAALMSLHPDSFKEAIHTHKSVLKKKQEASVSIRSRKIGHSILLTSSLESFPTLVFICIHTLHLLGCRFLYKGQRRHQICLDCS